ncbi:MAG: hypothetical protein IIA64_04175 [Planctomycetes bacterium]|nr:hypothetical protein [Planctomycetota bacterium]
MRMLAPICIAALLAVTIVCAQDDVQSIRFDAIDVYVQTGDEPLAAYQLDLSAAKGDVTIVGIEGGQSEVFTAPPYYDPAAIQNDRVIIASFSTAAADALPRGKVRIATIHVQIVGDIEPEYDATITVAATVDGEPIDAELILETGPTQ